ncbi:MAG: hypothetical protein HGB12_13965 [Bacteroidetes bacterium]|nr:hypothetical protein [Bacteroidota bacterium]
MLTIIGVMFYFNNTKLDKKINDLKISSELGISNIKKLKLTAELSNIENQKKEADTLYTKHKLKNAQKEYLSIIVKISELLKEEAQITLDRLKKYGNSTAESEKLFNDANDKISKIDYESAYNLYYLCIEKNRDLTTKYINEADKNKSILDENISREIIIGQLNTDYIVSDIKILLSGEWAVATIKPKTFKTDNAFIALQKQNEKWSVMAGPGTYFDKSDYPNIPFIVIEALNGGA